MNRLAAICRDRHASRHTDAVVQAMDAGDSGHHRQSSSMLPLLPLITTPGAQYEFIIHLILRVSRSFSIFYLVYSGQ